MTDPDQLAQSDARRLKSIRSSGRCVTITPRSQWTFLWRENDVAMMAYAGRIGPPGSYYIKVSDLLDAEGRHPDETSAAPSDASVSPVPQDAAAIAMPAASDPPAVPPAVAAQTGSPAPPGKSIDDLIADTRGRSPELSAMPPGRTYDESQASTARIWVPAGLVALFVAALGGFLALRRRQGKTNSSASALEAALSEIHAQAPALRQAKSDAMRPDRYGTTHADGWEREKALFVNSRVLAKLRDAGYPDTLPALLPAIDAEIERQANALVAPGEFVPDTGLDYAYDGRAQGIDPDLSTYATRCESLLQNAGWTTEPAPAETGGGVGILAQRGGRKLVLQCKGSGAPVGVEAVQQVFALKDRRRADVAAIVTHATFTRAAQQMASANGVHALHDDGLIQLIR